MAPKVIKKYWSDEALQKVWEQAWLESNGTNPYSVSIDKKLREKGLSIHDIKTRLGVIESKRQRERYDSEQALLDFDGQLRFMAEQALRDRCAESTNGAIFLLESKYGYRKGQDINITANPDAIKTIRQWGDTAPVEPLEIVDGSKEVSVG